MTFNALEELRAAGVIKANANPAVTEVLGALDEHEVKFLKSLTAKIAAAQPEIVAHSADDEEDTPCFVSQTVIR